MLSSGLVVVHDALLSSEHTQSILSGGQDLVHSGIDVAKFQIEPWSDGSALVDAAGQLHDNLLGTLVVNDLDVIDVS